MTTKGYFTFILHSHLPYVLSHGRWPHGTDWLNEAAAETYLPMLNVFNRLVEEGRRPAVTLGITPVLAEQLASDSFKKEFEDYLENKINVSEDDIAYFTKIGETHLSGIAAMWKEFYASALSDFTDKYKSDLIGAFRSLQDEGAVEIITCAATHGYLPLLLEDDCVKAQVAVGADTYRRHFGRDPRGIWLPECAYRPAYNWAPPIKGFGGERPRKGLEEFLHENGINYFIVDSHLLDGSKPIGAYLERFGMLKQLFERFSKQYPIQIEGDPKTSHQAYMVASSEKAERFANILTRDAQSGLQVWSGEYGYPGDGNYLDFHKKHFPGGNRYWRVTNAKADLADKQVYDPAAVEARIRENADHFTQLVRRILRENHEGTGGPGIVAAPFDSELFGHWWFEGPRWLYRVLQIFDEDPEVELVTGNEYLEKHPPRQIVQIPEGSWGEGGYHWIWLNEWTQWTWKHIYESETKMIRLAKETAGDGDPTLGRLLRQLGRELLLLESSDWQFLISTWSARDYAEMRISRHFTDFNRLHDILIRYRETGALKPEDETFISELEVRDTLFADLDVDHWR